jgi:hypothetical protein
MKIEVEICSVPAVACPECANLLAIIEAESDGDS